MSRAKTGAPTGLLTPWRLSDREAVFLDDENFYLLTDQAQMALARQALARDVGAYWRDDDYCLPGLSVEARGDDLLFRITGGRFAGVTGAGMTVQGEPQEFLRNGPFSDGTYVVGLLADCHPSRSARPEIVVSRLPVAPTWLSFCLPLGFFRKRERQVQRVYADWDLRAVTLADLRAEDGGDRADRAYALCRDLDAQVRALMPLVRERLQPLLEPLLQVALLTTLRDQWSLAARWKEVLRAGHALSAVRAHLHPFDVKPVDILHEDFGIVIAHFIEPALALLQWIQHVISQLLAAAQAKREFPFDSFRSRWWSGLSVGSMQLLPALYIKEWDPSVLRVAQLISIGRHDAEARCWEFNLDRKRHSFSEHVVLVMLPASERPWLSQSVPIRIEPASQDKPHHTLRFAAGRPWAAYWLPGGIKTMTDSVRITYQSAMPEVSAALLWEVVSCQEGAP